MCHVGGQLLLRQPNGRLEPIRHSLLESPQEHLFHQQSRVAASTALKHDVAGSKGHHSGLRPGQPVNCSWRRHCCLSFNSAVQIGLEPVERAADGLPPDEHTDLQAAASAEDNGDKVTVP